MIKRGRLNERDFAIIIELVIGSLQVGEAISRELGVEELVTILPVESKSDQAARDLFGLTELPENCLEEGGGY